MTPVAESVAVTPVVISPVTPFPMSPVMPVPMSPCVVAEDELEGGGGGAMTPPGMSPAKAGSARTRVNTHAAQIFLRFLIVFSKLLVSSFGVYALIGGR